MNFGLIIVGDEILSGKRADKHLPRFIELLAARGLSLAWADYVGDDPARITATLRRAFEGGDVVFSTGGIGATLIPNPYNKIPGFSVMSSRNAALPEHALAEAAPAGAVHFLPGFPVMAWPMAEWVLDTHWAHLARPVVIQERSVIVFGAMEASLTPLMEAVELANPGVKVFSLPSVDHPVHGKHIELGVKGDNARLEAAYAQLRTGLHEYGASIGPELVR
ncbi:MAG: competence/damage-inducible protein A [Comamonadaceae bacterium]|nr:MAG: competence/damage-inducible protein A [Comamonadaceae bacterium]